MNPLTMAAGGVLIAAAAGLAGYGKGYFAGSSSVQQKWDKEKAAQMAEYAAAQQAAREQEQKLQANADNLRKEKDREIRDLNARSIALSNSLRDRQSRSEAGGMSKDAGSGSSQCDGSKLSREDAEFLVGEANAADQIRLALNQCIAQYKAAKH